MTSSFFRLLSTLMARHLRVNSSITVSIRKALPLCVRAITKSYAHTWLGQHGRSRTHEPSLSHNRFLFGCLCGTFSPSSRQIRSTRLWFTDQPSLRSKAVMRRYPYRPYSLARETMARVKESSSFGVRLAYRCVERGCPMTLQARRSETSNTERICTTHLRRRSGLSIFPAKPR